MAWLIDGLILDGFIRYHGSFSSDAETVPLPNFPKNKLNSLVRTSFMKVLRVIAKTRYSWAKINSGRKIAKTSFFAKRAQFSILRKK